MPTDSNQESLDMNKKTMTAVLLVALSASVSAEAAVITQWNFNSVVADGSTGTGVTTPSIGSGFASLVGGVTNPSFNSGVGSSDPAASDNSGWQTTTYASQGTGDKARGTQYQVSTLGYSNITLSYDLRHSNTSSRYEQVQYTLDGTHFSDIGGLYDGNAGDTWFNGRTIDLSSVAGVADNANFGFRVVAAFAPSTGTYLASDSTKTYATSGTWRFDMVSVSGAVAAAVPVPGSVWLFGSALLGFLGLSRRKA